MEKRTGWNRITTLTLLRRMEAQGAVVSDTEGSMKSFRPLVFRQDATLQKPENFLGWAYR
ncbi:MAG: BlaI/MecI/CopY family transcriptional regulator [Lawsonibacter sp.]|nr:BlaI/MecI/CopY family transcriptional regulator [Lawsonibacter sp.]